MSNINKITVNGTTYDIEDTTARTSVGNMTSLETTATDLVGAINEVNYKYRNDIVIEKNLVKTLTAQTTSGVVAGSKVTLSDSSTRACAVIDIEGGKTYSVNQFASNNFSGFAETRSDGDYWIGAINSYKVNNDIGYVYESPSNATKLYLCNTGWTVSQGLVVLEKSTETTGHQLVDYPFDTVKKVKINKLAGDVVDDVYTKIDGIYPNKVFSIGNIAISTSGWTESTSPSRARTNTDNPYHLNAGDIIHLTNYEKVRMYLGIRDSAGTYYSAGWLREDYVVQFECDVVVLLSYVTETTIAHADELAQYLRVYTHGTLFESAQISRISNDNIKSVNHQGYNFIAPAETLPAYKLSKKYGFDYVECDVLITSDGEYVLNHDDNIATTGIFYNITGNTPTLVTTATYISQTTYADLVANYDKRKSTDDEYEGCKIAKFSDFIALCKYIGLHPYIELKSGGSTDSQALYNIVKSYGMTKNVTWVSATINYLNHIKNIDSSARLGYIVNTIDDSAITAISNLKTDNNEVFIDANRTNLTSTLVQKCIDAGLPLEVWIVDTVNQLKQLSPYVTGVTSDVMHAGQVFFNNNNV